MIRAITGRMIVQYTGTNSEMLDDWLGKKLEDRREKGLFRMLPGEHHLVHFASNDYLGLSRHEGLYNRIKEAVAVLPKKNGSTGSRLCQGTRIAIHRVDGFYNDKDPACTFGDLFFKICKVIVSEAVFFCKAESDAILDACMGELIVNHRIVFLRNRRKYSQVC